MFNQLIHLLDSLCEQVSEPPRLKICDRYANSQLQNQFGATIHFRERFIDDGRALIINTMYTTCRGTCSGTSAVIEALRDVLSPVFGDRLSIVSLSIDPVVDTPLKLAEYAKTYGADRDRAGMCEWQFLTGTLAEVDSLRRSLGFYDLNPRVDQDVTQHASTLMFGNSTTDRWSSMPSELPKNQLITSIRRVAGFSFEQKYGIPS